MLGASADFLQPIPPWLPFPAYSHPQHLYFPFGYPSTPCHEIITKPAAATALQKWNKMDMLIHHDGNPRLSPLQATVPGGNNAQVSRFNGRSLDLTMVATKFTASLPWPQYLPVTKSNLFAQSLVRQEYDLISSHCPQVSSHLLYL